MSLTALDITERCFAPEMVVYENCECLKDFSRKNPTLSRCIFVPLSALSGFVKTFLFPVIAVICAVILPIIGALKLCLNHKDGGEYMKAGAWCLLGVLGTGVFMMVSAYYIPLPASATCFMVAISISIAVHVHRAAKIPEPSKEQVVGRPGSLPLLSS